MSLLKRVAAGDVFLVHNGSRLKDVEILESRFPGIHHLKVKGNKGFAAGANLGLEKAFESHDAAYFFSNDTEVMSLPKSIPTIDLGAATVFRRSTGMIESMGGTLNPWRGTLSHNKNPQEFSRYSYVPGSCFFISKHAWKTLNGFREELGTYWEDVDLTFRALKSGLKIGLVKDLAVKHGIAKTCGNDPLYTVFFYNRNRLKVCMRHSRLSHKISFVFYFGCDILRRSFKYLRTRDWIRFRYIIESIIYGISSSPYPHR